MVPGMLELRSVEAQPHQPHPEGEQLVVALGFSHDGTSLGDSLGGDGKTQIDIGGHLPIPIESEANFKNSAAGGLHKYANPSLIEQEKDAWRKAAIKKHAQE